MKQMRSQTPMHPRIRGGRWWAEMNKSELERITAELVDDTLEVADEFITEKRK